MSKSQQPRSIWLKLLVLLVAAGATAVLYYSLGDSIRFEKLAEQESWLRSRFEANPLLFLIGAFVLYVLVTGLSLPGATVLSLSYAWFFGFWKAVILISFASTSGATIAFLLSRFLFRDAIQNKFSDRLATINQNLEKEGAFYLFTMRLIPAIPFFVINPVMGLTPMRIRTYWWVSQLGMLPATIVYVLVGASVPDLNTFAEEGVSGILSWQLISAFVLLGVFPFLVKKSFEWFKQKRSTADFSPKQPDSAE